MWLTTPLQRDGGARPLRKLFHVPGFGDVGQKRARHDAVNPHLWPVGVRKRTGQRIEACLGRTTNVPMDE